MSRNLSQDSLMKHARWLFTVCGVSMLSILGMTCPNQMPPNGDNEPCPQCLCTQQPVGTPQIQVGDHVMSVGSPTVTVFEYSDLGCPFCATFELNTLPTLKTEYIDTGLVRWVFRHFPITQLHPRAAKAAEATECADDQGQFEAMKTRLFQNRTTWGPQNANDAVATFKALFGQIPGVNQAAFDTCVDGTGKAARVQNDVNSGTNLGVSGTPTFYINGRCYRGAISLATFRQILDKAIADAANSN